MPRFQCPKAETRKTKHLQPLILPHNRTPIETHTHTQKIFKQNIPKGGFKLRKSWIHAKSYCGVRFGLTCSLLLKIYSLSERPIDCPLYFPRLLFFFFFFFFLSYDASLLACNWRMGFFCKFVSGNICAHELWTPKKNRVATMANTPFSSLSLSLSLSPPLPPPLPPPPLWREMQNRRKLASSTKRTCSFACVGPVTRVGPVVAFLQSPSMTWCKAKGGQGGRRVRD